MKYFGGNLSKKHKELNKIIRKAEDIRRTKELFFEIHAKLHLSIVSGTEEKGGVTEQMDSIWLLDFWGKKDVAGILLMPPTRHVMLHLNDCCKWKEQIRTKGRRKNAREGEHSL